MKKESKTTQIGLRIEIDLLKSVEEYAKDLGVDRMTLIRLAVTEFILDMEREDDLESIEDYIAGLIDNKQFREETGMEKVPADIQEARKSRLKLLVEKKSKR